MSGGVVCQPVSTLKADILSITYDCYSQNNNVKVATITLIIGDAFLFSFAVNVNEQRIIAFLTEKCFYLILRSKVMWSILLQSHVEFIHD